ncbi:hypothetical protein B0H10DRAFT_1833931 [Mycena sp. CBHHK59/15]|nr:hypothetical protein B0H10DRAFT_1833931 [Mycena sp. CBHHK59/15]
MYSYTTYDVRRDQDVLNPKAQSFIMVCSPETEPGAHPYWYAQILGVFNSTVFRVTPLHGATSPAVMEFLWVRWLGVEPGYRSGIQRARLPKVGFVPESDPYAFGFLDPAHVIRGSHLIPDFSGGRTNDLLTTQNVTAARSTDDTEDWANYYRGTCLSKQLLSFADRDMIMRYVGGGIGHLDVQSLSGTDIEMQEDNNEHIGGLGDIGGDSDDDKSGGSGSDSSDSEDEEDEDDDARDGSAAQGAMDMGDDGEDFGLGDDEDIDMDVDGFAAF